MVGAREQVMVGARRQAMVGARGQAMVLEHGWLEGLSELPQLATPPQLSLTTNYYQTHKV